MIENTSLYKTPDGCTEAIPYYDSKLSFSVLHNRRLPRA